VGEPEQGVTYRPTDAPGFVPGLLQRPGDLNDWTGWTQAGWIP
jgi:hypothetical protein